MPWASRKFGDRTIWKRIHGHSFAATNGTSVTIFVVPYAHCKITAIEVINCAAMDVASFAVLDTQAGTYKGIPNAVLNQVAFSTILPAGFYSHRAEYDADLYMGMQLRVTYTASVLLPRQVGVNFILHELV
jgi:hypothetical protein